LGFYESGEVSDYVHTDLTQRTVITFSCRGRIALRRLFPDSSRREGGGSTPFEVTVYKAGEKYVVARSNEFGFANY
jgi:hypothetical protein